MNNFEILHLLKNGAKIRKKNWKKGWFIFINTTKSSEFDIETFFVDCSSKMKDDLLKIKEKFDYQSAIDDLIFEKWETYKDDGN